MSEEDKYFIKRYEELLDKGYCDCNEMNCIDNNSPRRILNIVKELQNQLQQKENIIKGLDNTIENLEKVVEHKENIIKEVREFVEKRKCVDGDGTVSFDINTNPDDLLRILDKGE